jgi:hypothetical protein
MYYKTFFLNEQDDIEFDAAKKLKMITGAEKLAQDFRVLLRTHKGELITHTEIGLDYNAYMATDSTGVHRGIIETTLRQHPWFEKLVSATVTVDSVTRRERWELTIQLKTQEEVVVVV